MTKPTRSPIDITNWALRSANNVLFSGGVSNTFARVTITARTVVQPGCYFLLANSNTNNGPYSGSVAADLTYGAGIADDRAPADRLALGDQLVPVGDERPERLVDQLSLVWGGGGHVQCRDLRIIWAKQMPEVNAQINAAALFHALG